MGRDATKAAGNPWYQARKKAAEYDDRLWAPEEVRRERMISRGDAPAMVDERLRIDAEEFKTLHLMSDVWLRNMDLDVTAEMVSAYIFAKEKQA